MSRTQPRGLRPKNPTLSKRGSVNFDYEEESDPGPYPIPPDAPIEGGAQSNGDRHVLVVDVDACRLYEMWYAWPQPDGSWHAGSGAVFDLRANALRPDTWTSADAAGLPILPGLVRYDEVAAGEIRHALRFTAAQTRAAHVWPARHHASDLTDPAIPPMGQRFRLRADFDISGYSPEVQVILSALKRYGMFLADNGSDWYISGAPDARWDNDTLVGELATVLGANFEAVDESACMIDPDSAQAGCFPPPDHRAWLPLVWLRRSPPAGRSRLRTVLEEGSMDIGAQISLYPLGQADLLPGIQDVWDALEEAGLRTEPGPMSTLVFGPDQVILEALRQGFRGACRRGPAVMVITLTNACPWPKER